MTDLEQILVLLLAASLLLNFKQWVWPPRSECSVTYVLNDRVVPPEEFIKASAEFDEKFDEQLEKLRRKPR